jgi:hypothetical protein
MIFNVGVFDNLLTGMKLEFLNLNPCKSGIFWQMC